ncbi:MAG: glutathione S-transferase family protein [Alphaproteobacteria bacterium]|nr:glutathione S-transferase family protein [Alphaproteobacteria bacterium]
MLKLFYAPNACSLAPHIALEEAGADYEAILVDTKAGEQREPAYLSVNPKGRVPALATEHGILTEVPVLLGFIARSFPKADLAPADMFAFFEMQSFNTYLASTIHITYAHLFRPERYADSDAAKAEMGAKVAGNLGTQFQLVEDRFADGREWVHGGQYTVSDPYLYVFTRWLDREGAGGIARFPKLAAHRARMQARPAVQKALEQEGLAPV